MLEKIKVFVFFLLLLGAALFVGFFPMQSQVVRYAVCAFSFLSCSLLFYYSKMGQDLLVFSKESVREAAKVFWPTRKETAQLVLVVFAFTTLMAVYLFFVDKFLEGLLYNLILGWK